MIHSFNTSINVYLKISSSWTMDNTIRDIHIKISKFSINVIEKVNNTQHKVEHRPSSTFIIVIVSNI